MYYVLAMDEWISISMQQYHNLYEGIDSYQPVKLKSAESHSLKHSSFLFDHWCFPMGGWLH